jgi:hypothetical protein
MQGTALLTVSDVPHTSAMTDNAWQMRSKLPVMTVGK